MYDVLKELINNSRELDLETLIQSKRFDLKSKDAEGKTLLHHAAILGKESCIEVLLSLGANINTRDKQLMDALMYAAEAGHISCVLLLLQKGAFVHSEDVDGWTALMHAADEGHLDCLNALIKANANIHKTSNDKETPIMLAAMNDYQACVQSLITQGVDVELEFNNALQERNSLYAKKLIPYLKDIRELFVKAINQDDEEAIQTFKEMGMSLEAEFDTALENNDMAYAENLIPYINLKARWSDAIKAKNAKLISSLSRLSNSSEATEAAMAMIKAAHDNDAETIRILIDAGISPLVTHPKDWTPSMEAAKYGKLNALEALKTSEGTIAGFEKESPTGATPLILAAKHGHLNCLKILLLEEGKIFFKYSLQGIRVHLFQNIVQLLANPKGINHQDERGYSAFMWALENNHYDCAKEMLEGEFSITTKHKIKQMASDQFRINIEELSNMVLVDLNLTNNTGETALDIATRIAKRTGNYACVDLINKHLPVNQAVSTP